MLVAAILAVAYLIWSPQTADLAAQTFRSDLFSAHGYLIWNNWWYSGHYLPGYSLLFPPLGAALGPELAGALAAVASAACFGVLARRGYGDRSRLAVAWFGAATVSSLVAGQITFALGVAIGLAALVALQRGRRLLALALAALSAVASPVAGLFLGIAGAVVWLGGERRGGAFLVAGGLVPTLALSIALPVDGYFPFVFSAFAPVALLALAALFLVPSEERWARLGIGVYFLVSLFFFVVHSPVGANAARLGALFGGPLLALVLAGRRPLALALLAVPLLYWQWAAPIRDAAHAAGEPSTSASFYRPLLARLDTLTSAPARIEIPPTQNRWESAYVAPHYPLARGWLRQLESADFDPFTGGRLTPTAYRRWLDDRAVAYVAVANAPLDYLARDEASLIATGLPYLHRVWSDADWSLYRVLHATPLVAPAGGALTSLGPADFSLRVRRPGSYLVRVHYTPYWTLTAGSACVERDGDWTRIQARRAGTLSVSARFSFGAVAGRDRSCSG